MLRPLVSWCAPLGAVLLTQACATAQDSDGTPREFGRVQWQRKLEPALSMSKESGKPVFLLFQEVPGCSTCVGFGESALSLAPMVEAIETQFVPVAIRNNVEGYEEAVRERFEEPSWNNPVVRFVGADGEDVIPRQDRVWQTEALLARMLAALAAAEREVPAWLDLYAQESLPGETERAVFAMHCFWVGEAKLGSLDGVVSATAAWVDGLEVVDVRYRPERLTYARLLDAAREVQCASKVFTTNGEQAAACKERGLACAALTGAPRSAEESDHLHDLRSSPLRYLPLTPLQALRVNAALGNGTQPEIWLAPSQVELASSVSAVAREDADRLEGLERPDEVAALAGYEQRLRRALEGR